MRNFIRLSLPLLLLVLVLAACASSNATPTSAPDDTPETTPADEATAAPTDEPVVPSPEEALPPVVEYDLGETTIVQAGFPEDSRFREMPVRLNGIIAVPADDGQEHPVVVILHGTHPGCPLDESGIDRWPCAPEVEQTNYRGFAYLVQSLAAQGYVAVSININAENTFGFGEPVPGERFAQLVDLHLGALAEAVAGGANEFGVELAGRAAVQRMALFGHSRGGEGASWLANSRGLADADAFDSYGYGPVAGLLLLAPAPIFTLPAASAVPQVVLLPACDGDIAHQEGQYFYEGARLDPAQREWAVSIWLEQANHNAFNEILGADFLGNMGRSECEELLEPETQRTFLVDAGIAFLEAIFSEDPAEVTDAMARLGMDSGAPAPDMLLGLPARTAVLAAASERRPLLIPAGPDELNVNLLGGDVTADRVSTFFCEEGYFTPTVRPGSEPCKRVNLTIPAHPAMVVVSWEETGASLRLALPEDAGDLRDYVAVSMRAAVDPLSPLNTSGERPVFSLQLTDSSGATAMIQTRENEPALTFPPGDVEEDAFFEGGIFTGRVPMTTLRFLLADYSGIDLGKIIEIALLFDQTPTGSLFIGDLEVVRRAAPSE